MDICLHLGAHRTGSTSLQVYLNENRKAFLRDRTTIWGPGRTRKGMFEGLMRNPSRLTRADRKLAQRSLGRIKIELTRASLNGIHRLILSEENIIGTMNSNLASCTFYGQVADRLARFAPAFGGHALRIGIATRSYETYWASALAFQIRGGHGFPDVDQLDRLTTQPRRWRHVIADIAHVFPEAQIAVWSFEAWGSQQPSQITALTGRLLPRRVGGAIEVNNASPRASEIAVIARSRGDHALADRLEQAQGRYQPFNAEQRHKLRQDYATDINWLIEGSDGLATYFDPTGETSRGSLYPRGSTADDEETRLGQTGREGIARPRAG